MKKLLLGLLLISAMTIKAEDTSEQISRQEFALQEINQQGSALEMEQSEEKQKDQVGQPVLEFNVEGWLQGIEDGAEIKELLRKAKAEGMLDEGIQERAATLSSYAAREQETIKRIEELADEASRTNHLDPRKVVKIISRLLKATEVGLDIINEAFSFSAESVRKFNVYPAEQVGYLAFERISNLANALIENDPTAQRARKDLRRELSARNKTDSQSFKNDLKELVNCIRSNPMPDKEKDRDCFLSMLVNIVERDYNQHINLTQFEN